MRIAFWMSAGQWALVVHSKFHWRILWINLSIASSSSLVTPVCLLENLIFSGASVNISLTLSQAHKFSVLNNTLVFVLHRFLSVFPREETCMSVVSQKGRWSSRLECPGKAWSARLSFSNQKHLSRLQEGGALLETAVSQGCKCFHLCLLSHSSWVIYLRPLTGQGLCITFENTSIVQTWPRISAIACLF